mmetsp:Transcript_27587/g.77222  ORF Transcript_27587/g.77222 Transcript_27587/m.77222 type:complete len:113 (+) Transcript_27587:574-912(+)
MTATVRETACAAAIIRAGGSTAVLCEASANFRLLLRAIQPPLALPPCAPSAPCSPSTFLRQRPRPRVASPPVVALIASSQSVWATHIASSLSANPSHRPPSASSTSPASSDE